jgi:hypothetical protein
VILPNDFLPKIQQIHSCQKTICHFCFFFYIRKHTFEVGMLRGCAGVIPKKEGGIHVLAGQGAFSQRRFLMRILWLAEQDRKMT